jgi:hypothetical protein
VWGANAYIAKSDMEMIEAVADVDKWSDRLAPHPILGLSVIHLFF